jgi:hypothetical protein
LKLTDLRVTSLAIARSEPLRPAAYRQGVRQSLFKISSPKSNSKIGEIMKVKLQNILLFLFFVFSVPLWGKIDDPSHMESDSLNVRLVAKWAVGTSGAIAADKERDLVFVGGRYDSVFVLDVSDPFDPERLGAIPSVGQWYKGLFYKDPNLYIAEYPHFRVISIVNPSNPEIVGEIVNYEQAQSVTVEDTIAYVSCDVGGGRGFIQFISIADPANPYNFGEYWPRDGTPWQIVIEDSLAYVANEGGGLLILSVANLSNPYEVGHYYQTGETFGLALRDSLVYIADSQGLIIVNISNPANPVETGFLSTPGYATNLDLHGSLIYLADREGGFRVICIDEPHNPVEVGYYQTVDRAWSVAYLEPYAYVVTDVEGLSIFEYLDPTSIGEEENIEITIPKSFSLSQNYPNPFNPSTRIDYSVSEKEAIDVQLIIYDLRGRMIRILIDEEKQPGRYSVYWDGKDNQGKAVSSGAYIYKIIVGAYSSSRKMIIIR